MTDTHIQGANLDAVALGILHQLGRRVETHGQGIEQAAVKGCRLMAFQPGGNVDQQGKTGGVRFGKAVLSKALHLIENTLGEFFAVATFEHAVNQLRFKVIESAAFLPGGHSAPKLISLSGTEACGHHGQLDHLFLKNRDA